MQHTRKTVKHSGDPPQRRPAADRAPNVARPAIDAERTEATAQRESLPSIAASPRVSAQQALGESIRFSPRMAVQRGQLHSVFGAAMQRQAGVDGGQPVQGHFEPDHGPAVDKGLDPLTGRLDTAQRQGASEQTLPSTMPPAPAVQLEAEPPGPPNRSALPDRLKQGIEALSGRAMDHVRVHYDSDQPAQLHAAAYAQGGDIHLAPGQEQHLPHEAWHVVQQAQGRVRPTLQLEGGVPVNDDPGLEREADVMGARAVQARPEGATGSGGGSATGSAAPASLDPVAATAGSAGGWPVQRKLSGTLDNLSVFTQALQKHNPKAIPAFKLYDWARKHKDTFTTIDQVLEAYELEQSTQPSKDSSKSDDAPKLHGAQSKQGFIVVPKEPKREAKQHRTVGKGARPLIINYVWLGRGQLDALARFNIYSWRALGHSVNVYSHHYEKDVKHTPGTLGLTEGDAGVFDMLEVLGVDKEAEGEQNPKVVLGDARSILIRWLLNSKNPERWPLIDDKKSPNFGKKDDKPSQDNRFNMIDLTKSYIGGTRRGIVLDTKVGPSTHLGDYEEALEQRFISYSRGGKAVRVENQSMGTMQESEELRLAYATAFNNKVKTNLSDADPDKKHFDLITGYHADGHAAAKGLDTAVQGPTGKESKEYTVSEPGAQGHGPFRVFKNAGHQTNQGNEISDEEKVRRAREIKFLAGDVFKSELRADKSGGDQGFLDKAKQALESMPEK